MHDRPLLIVSPHPSAQAPTSSLSVHLSDEFIVHQVIPCSNGGRHLEEGIWPRFDAMPLFQSSQLLCERMVPEDLVYPSGEITTDDVPVEQTGRTLVQLRHELAQCSCPCSTG